MVLFTGISYFTGLSKLTCVPAGGAVAAAPAAPAGGGAAPAGRFYFACMGIHEDCVGLEMCYAPPPPPTPPRANTT